MKDDQHPRDRRVDEAAGLPSPWFRPLVIVPLVIAVIVLLWGIFAAGWLF